MQSTDGGMDQRHFHAVLAADAIPLAVQWNLPIRLINLVDNQLGRPDGVGVLTHGSRACGSSRDQGQNRERPG